jgi:hypothetical protein
LNWEPQLALAHARRLRDTARDAGCERLAHIAADLERLNPENRAEMQANLRKLGEAWKASEAAMRHFLQSEAA